LRRRRTDKIRLRFPLTNSWSLRFLGFLVFAFVWFGVRAIVATRVRVLDALLFIEFSRQFLAAWFRPDISTVDNLLRNQRARFLVIAHHPEDSVIGEFFGIKNAALGEGLAHQQFFDF